jgi:hypothetical protein
MDLVTDLVPDMVHDPVLDMVPDPVPDMVPDPDMFPGIRALQNDAVQNTDFFVVEIVVNLNVNSMKLLQFVKFLKLYLLKDLRQKFEFSFHFCRKLCRR